MKHIVKRCLVFALAVLLVLPLLSSCGKREKALLTLEKDGTKVTLSVNIYELMLSRMKGSLVSSKVTAGGYTALESKFWDYFTDDQNITLNEIYKKAILDNCKTYTAVLWLFETRGLTLSQSAIASIDDRLEDLVQNQGGGSKTKLNSLLATYGVNYNMLREAYLMEAKVTALQKDLYGESGNLIGTAVKDQYLGEHYVRFKQIFLPSYDFEYEKDKYGDAIYYNPEKSEKEIAYDYTNGVRKLVNGIFETDANGDDIAYTGNTYDHIAYDTVNGKRNILLDSSGTAKTVQFTKEQLEELEEKADQLYTSLNGATAKTFEDAIAANLASSPKETDYTTDCYLSKDIDYGTDFSYLSEIVTKLETMQTGDIAKISSTSGYHIIMKYELESGAYDVEANEAWFKQFYSNLIDSLFLDYCRSYRDAVTVNEDVWASSKSMKEIAANLYY